MRKKIIPLAISLTLASAANAYHNSCAYLSIVIANDGPETCYLLDSRINYGRMSSRANLPREIYPGQASAPFEMRQTIFAPDLSLTYQCGQSRQITVESTQGYCLFSGGTVKGMAYNGYRMGAEYTKDDGSVWGRHGEITWYLQGY